MKLLFLIHNMSHRAGTERVLSSIANELAGRYYDITIASCRDGRNSGFKLDKRIKLVSLEGEKYGNPVVRRLKGIGKIRKLNKKNEYDYIICIDVSLVFYAMFAKYKNTKIIAWEHFNYGVNTGSKLQSYARHISCKNADILVVLTDRDKELYEKNEKDIKKIVRIYNPITTDNREWDIQRDKTVLAVGRLENQKGFDLLLDGWKNIEDKYSDWKLRIAGVGSKEAQLKQQMSDLQLKNVQFAGYIDDINEEFRKASVFVCSSRFEGFGMVILEAQANELPVVSFDCPYGPSELIKDGYTGILVENGDVPALSAGIEKLINDKDLRSRLAIEAKKWSESFNVTGICDRWEKLLKQGI
mgnify:FL=1